MACALPLETSYGTDDELSSGSLSPAKPRTPIRKKKKDKFIIRRNIYEPNPSCLCDTCELNYFLRLRRKGVVKRSGIQSNTWNLDDSQVRIETNVEKISKYKEAGNRPTSKLEPKNKSANENIGKGSENSKSTENVSKKSLIEKIFRIRRKRDVPENVNKDSEEKSGMVKESELKEISTSGKDYFTNQTDNSNETFLESLRSKLEGNVLTQRLLSKNTRDEEPLIEATYENTTDDEKEILRRYLEQSRKDKYIQKTNKGNGIMSFVSKTPNEKSVDERGSKKVEKIVGVDSVIRKKSIENSGRKKMVKFVDEIVTYGNIVHESGNKKMEQVVEEGSVACRNSVEELGSKKKEKVVVEDFVACEEIVQERGNQGMEKVVEEKSVAETCEKKDTSEECVVQENGYVCGQLKDSKDGVNNIILDQQEQTKGINEDENHEFQLPFEAKFFWGNAPPEFDRRRSPMKICDTKKCSSLLSSSSEESTSDIAKVETKPSMASMLNDEQESSCTICGKLIRDHFRHQVASLIYSISTEDSDPVKKTQTISQKTSHSADGKSRKNSHLNEGKSLKQTNANKIVPQRKSDSAEGRPHEKSQSSKIKPKKKPQPAARGRSATEMQRPPTCSRQGQDLRRAALQQRRRSANATRYRNLTLPNARRYEPLSVYGEGIERTPSGHVHYVVANINILLV